MRWLASQGCFSFDGVMVSGNMCVTKRLVLNLISRLFDPLGFLSPFIMARSYTGVPWHHNIVDTIVSLEPY